MFKIFLCTCLFSIALAAPKHKQNLAKYRPGGRVIGGVDAKIEDFPYMVSVAVDGGTHFCGASLISDTWALTAAHCVAGLLPTQIVVQGNSSLLDDGPKIAAKTLIFHPDYNSSTFDFDIGLIELSKPFNTTYTKPVTLSKTAPVPGKNVTLLGWGVWDPGCALPRYPGVYTLVTNFLDWIEQNSGVSA